MLRIVVQTCDAGMAANCGGSVLSTFKTFDVDLPEVEAELLKSAENTYAHSQIIGVELISITPPA